MIQTIIGFLTGLLAAGLGVRWYLAQSEFTAVPEVADRATPRNVGADRDEAPPLVTPELAEQLLQTPVPDAPEMVEAPRVADEAEDVTIQIEAPAEPEPIVTIEPEDELEAEPATSDEVPAPEAEAVEARPEKTPAATSAPEPAPPEPPPLRPSDEVVSRPVAATPAAAEPVPVPEPEPEPEPEQVMEPAEPVIGYCARCRTKREMANTEHTTTRNNRPAVRGECPECGAGMFVFVSDSS